MTGKSHARGGTRILEYTGTHCHIQTSLKTRHGDLEAPYDLDCTVVTIGNGFLVMEYKQDGQEGFVLGMPLTSVLFFSLTPLTPLSSSPDPNPGATDQD